MSLDADTLKHLEDVRKGKPRKFAMICKGVKIMSLVVYKKGTVEKFKKQAREQGKGQFYHGVVDGKGVNISFKMSTVDGYEKPPGKELILKDFLATEAGMKFKPVYEIVSELPEVSETDDEVELEGNGQGKTISTAPPLPGETPPKAPPTPTSDDASAFMSRLQLLLPALKKAQELRTTVSEQLKELATRAQEFAKRKDFVQGSAALDELEKLIKQALLEAKSGKDKTPGSSDGAFDRLWQAAKKAWQDASDTVDSQLSQLQSALRSSGDEDLLEIADFGLNGVTGNHKVPLLAAMRDVENSNGDGRAKAVGKLAAIVADFQKYLLNEPTVTACDDNPFGVKVSIRETLTGALSSFEKAIQAAGK